MIIYNIEKLELAKVQFINKISRESVILDELLKNNENVYNQSMLINYLKRDLNEIQLTLENDGISLEYTTFDKSPLFKMCDGMKELNNG